MKALSLSIFIVIFLVDGANAYIWTSTILQRQRILQIARLCARIYLCGQQTPARIPAQVTSAGVKAGGPNIARMTLFKASQNSQALLAEVSSNKNIVSYAHKTSDVEGFLSQNYATIQVDLMDSVDCQAEYICHVLMSDGQLKVLTTANDQKFTGTRPEGDVSPTSTVGLPHVTEISDQQSNPAPHTLSLVEDLTANVAILDSKFYEVHFAEQRLSAQMTSLTTDLTAAEQRLKDEFSIHVASLKADIMSAEQRLKDVYATQVSTIKADIGSVRDELASVEQNEKMELSNVEQSLTAALSASEQRLNTKMSDVERSMQANLQREHSLLIDKLDSTTCQTYDTSSYIETLVSSLKDGVKVLKKDILDSIIFNISDMSNGLVTIIDEKHNHFLNASDDLKLRVSQALDSFISIEQNMKNFTCNQNVGSLIESVRKEIVNVSCYSEENGSALKHSQCKKGMLPVEAVFPYPYPIFYPEKTSVIDIPYMCDADTNFGGWILIQRRTTGSLDFYRGWNEYKEGFGSLSDDFWLGLEPIHKLTTSAKFELRVDLKYQGKSVYALYSIFSIGNEADNYRLNVGGYSGTAGDSLTAGPHNHNWMSFTTKDRDNDNLDVENCALRHHGAWWYNICHYSGLNGQWLNHENQGLKWYTLTGTDTVTFSEMKIRKSN